MSSNRDGFDDRRDEGAGWQEPAHLGQGGEQPPADRERSHAEESRADENAAGWEPPGWSLPPAEPRPEPAAPPAGGLFRPRERRLTEGQSVFRYEGDLVGAQGWAVQQGWTISDGTGPQDAVLAELIATAPVRLTKDFRPAGVMRGRAGTLELVAFDVVYASGRYVVPKYAVTAAPVLVPLPRLRLSPARFWKHRTGGLLQVPSGDEEFDLRWVLLTEQDTPEVRRLVQDPTLRGLLLGSDDGDEFWTAAGHGGGWAGGFIAAVRPDGHRPLLIEHHARLLGAVVGALAGA